MHRLLAYLLLVLGVLTLVFLGAIESALQIFSTLLLHILQALTR